MIKMTGVTLLIALFLSAGLARATESSCFNLSSSQCGRIQNVVSHWKTPAFAALPIVGTADAAPVTSERPDPKLDQANGLAAEAEAVIGPCRFNETESRVEVQEAAFKLESEALTQCLAAAYAQARYRGVESAWLRRVGEHQAWIVRGGETVKVAVDAKLERPAARLFWASFATRELLNAAQASAEVPTVEADRSVASIGAAKQTATAKDVRALLGIN